jgi:hypothetical protein
VFLATAIASSILGFAAFKLVLDEKSFGEEAFLGIDVWLLQAVLPFAFFLISYRCLLNMMVPPDVSPAEWDEFDGVGVSGEAVPGDVRTEEESGDGTRGESRKNESNEVGRGGDAEDDSHGRNIDESGGGPKGDSADGDDSTRREGGSES